MRICTHQLNQLKMFLNEQLKTKQEKEKLQKQQQQKLDNKMNKE